MHDFWEAIKRGVRMSRRTLWKALEVLAILVLLITIASAPFTVNLIDNPWYKGLWWFLMVCLVLIFAVVIGLMPYFGIREVKRDVETELAKKEGELEEKAWLINLASQQLADLGDYLYTMVHRIDYTRLADNHIIKVEVELLNLTVFTLDITSVRLDTECAGYQLGKEIEDNTSKRVVRGKRETFELEYQITNMQFLAYFKEVYSKRERLGWRFHIAWDLKTTKYDRELSVKHDSSIKDVPDVPQRVIDAL